MTTVEASSKDQPTMLLSFRFENVRSFHDAAELSLAAGPLAEKGVVRDLRVGGGGTIAALPVAAILGANAAGKSNVLRSLADMRRAVLESFRSWAPGSGTRRQPFALDGRSPEVPTRFEIDMVLGGIRHGYGFAMDSESVVEEWATRYPHGRAATIFRRSGLDVKWGASTDAVKSRGVSALLRSNALVLSTAAAAEHPDLIRLYQWFRRNLLMADPANREERQIFSARMVGKSDSKERIMALLRAADLGLSDVREVDAPPEVRDRLSRVVRILQGDDDGEPVADVELLAFSSLELVHEGDGVSATFSPGDESDGTLVWLSLIGPVIDALEHGLVLLVDELDASLHPDLSARVVRLFQDVETNPRHAQLVFTTHDVNLLGELDGRRLLGRDQVWFTEKRGGASVIYPLSDFAPRKAEAVPRRYLDGRYGGRPILADGDFVAAAELITMGSR